MRTQVAPVHVSQHSLMGAAEDGLHQVTAGRVLQEHQQRTEAETQRLKAEQYPLRSSLSRCPRQFYQTSTVHPERGSKTEGTLHFFGK